METRHESPKPDTMFRLRAPLTIGFPDGQSVRIDDWSLRAVYSAGLAGRPLEGLMLSIPFQGVGIYFPIELEKGDSDTEFLFRNLTGRERETLALFYRNLLSGRMTTTTEMISALDTPVDLVPMEETASERAAAVARLAPRRTRMLANLAWYLVLFALVAGFLGLTGWNRMTRVPVIAARVSAEIREIRAPADGFVREIPAAAGAGVSPGETLIRLDEREALHRLTEAEAAREATRHRLALAEARRLEHMAQSQAARATFRGGVERFDQGISVNPGDFHDIRLRIEAEIAALRAEIDRLDALILSHAERTEPAALAAPGEGVVLSHLVSPFDPVRAGDPLLRFEAAGPRGITAWLDWSRTGEIWPGMAAEIRWLHEGQPQSQPGRVRELSTVGSGRDLLIVARIALTEMSAEESRRLLTPEQPVEVTLRAEPLARWFGAGE